ncbi:MAG: hypothetical protein QM770_08525 [Tepidisphaeraceae bacterium]
MLRNHGLSIVVFSIFLVCWAFQILTGFYVYNDDRHDRGREQVSLWRYIRTAHFLEATAENWESEFLQMGAFVWLTSVLTERGSPESKHPDDKLESKPVAPDSPWPVRRGGWVLKLYENSLVATFLLLFAVSFTLHAIGGARLYNEEQREHGQPPIHLRQYVFTSQFWFESMQNWQSEFLSIGVMVVGSIYLRQRGSPESKKVESPHSSNE